MMSIRSCQPFSLAIAMALWGATLPSARAADERATPTALEEVVVTATKRQERLQDVPSAVSALSAETLLRTGVQDFRDYATLVPGLSQRDNGVPGTGTIILRGMNTSAQQTTNTTGYYLDEAPFSASGFLSVNGLLTPNPDLGDVERIEVLKGPQGTLFGANSLGGLIRVISKAPDSSEFSANVRAELSSVAGGDTGYSGRGAVNLPWVTDKVALRVSGGYRRSAGFIDNVQTGSDDVNETDLFGGRVALRATPTEQLTLDFVAFSQKIESSGSSVQDNVPGSLTPATREYAYSAFADLPSEIDYKLYSASVDYDFGRVSWLTTVSHAEIESDLQSDATSTYLPLVAALVPPGTVALQRLGPNNTKRTLESRLTSERLGAFEFVAGVFYTEEESEYPVLLSMVNPTTQVPVPVFGTLVRTGTLSEYEETSVFGNVTYFFNEAFDVTLGLRSANNKDRSTTGAPVGGVPASVFFAPRVTRVFRDSDSPKSYLATMRWRPSERISTYLRAASSYRPGGPQTNPAPPVGAQTEIKPDKVWSYEAGVKGAFLDGLLSLDASAYHIDWKDIQLPSLFGGIVLQGNAGRAKIDGAEFTATLRPTDTLSLSAAAGYTNARVTEISAGASANLGALRGDRLPLTPKWTAALIADQTFPLGTSWTGSVGATLRTQSDMPTSYPTSISDPNIVLPGFTTVDIRAGLSWDRYELQLRAENLFDRLAYTSGAPTGAYVIRPRTLALSMSASF